LQLNVRTKKGICIIEAAGRLVLEDGEDVLRGEIARQLDEGRRRFVLNLNGLSVIDSAGVGELVSCYQTASERGAVVKIALRPDGLAYKVFRVSGLDRALEVFSEEADAIASYT
jgi:anti-anti-sigma factor